MKRMWSKSELLRMDDAQIRALIESGEIENAKPIYCHPIVIENQRSDRYTMALCMLLFDNNSDSYTPDNYDPTTLIAHLKAFSTGARILLTGSVYDKVNQVNVVANQLYFDGAHLYICGIDNSGTYHTSSVAPLDLEVINIDYCNDVVNKIN